MQCKVTKYIETNGEGHGQKGWGESFLEILLGIFVIALVTGLVQSNLDLLN